MTIFPAWLAQFPRTRPPLTSPQLPLHNLHCNRQASQSLKGNYRSPGGWSGTRGGRSCRTGAIHNWGGCKVKPRAPCASWTCTGWSTEYCSPGLIGLACYWYISLSVLATRLSWINRLTLNYGVAMVQLCMMDHGMGGQHGDSVSSVMIC